ncbi:hypothetical protein BC826DRAFT_910313 [Russula brevipes]|nr:hypothetical protein BC826DRAFT_910313 [Russula brevipes]
MPGRRPTTIFSSLDHATRTIKAPRRSYTRPSSAIDFQFRVSRGGQNLSERFRKLEKTLRARHDLSHTVTEASRRPLTPVPSSTSQQQRPSVATFRGFVIPEVPKAPEPDECCMSGCAICVHDIYQESLDEYNSSVAAVRVNLVALNVPVEEWPETIRPGSEKRTSSQASGVSLSAFEEVERALKARREAQAQS